MIDLLVGAEGFEPPTLCSQSRCATRLRYAPTVVLIVSWNGCALGLAYEAQWRVSQVSSHKISAIGMANTMATPKAMSNRNTQSLHV